MWNKLQKLILKLKRGAAFCRKHGLRVLMVEKVFDRVIRRWHESKYIWSPRRIWRTPTKVRIDRPIFIFGTQGAGLTLLARIIHRHPAVVTISGNYRYWTGKDEMHNAWYLKDLPDQLTLRSPGYNNLTGQEESHPLFGLERSWVYATRYFFDKYRLVAEDATDDLKEAFLKAVKRALIVYADDPSRARFLDKSQSFSLKVPFLIETLKEYSPKFIVCLRNPYAICWGRVSGPHSHVYSKIPEKKTQVRLAAEHWLNIYQTALSDLKEYGDYYVVRFEDLLNYPKEVARRVFEHCELEFDEDFLPQPYHRLPLGSIDRSKWYPLRPNVNEKYLSKIPNYAVDIIHQYCGRLAEEFDYARP